MLNRRLQQRTAYLLLVLLGLIGAAGSGLHNLLDCCPCQTPEFGTCCTGAESTEFDCVFCQEHRLVRSETSSGTENSGTGNTTSSIASSHEDCAICQLLSLFHVTTSATVWQHFIYGNRESLAIRLSSFAPTSPFRLALPRGPPAELINSCYA